MLYLARRFAYYIVFVSLRVTFSSCIYSVHPDCLFTNSTSCLRNLDVSRLSVELDVMDRDFFICSPWPRGRSFRLLRGPTVSRAVNTIIYIYYLMIRTPVDWLTRVYVFSLHRPGEWLVFGNVCVCHSVCRKRM